MKSVITALLLIAIAITNAQTNCQNSQPFCAGGVSGVTYPASINSGAAQSGPNYGCLITQPNPAWYYLQVSTPGNLVILIQGQTNASPPGPGQDVDFICWGPFSSLAGVCNSLTAPNIVDCSYSASFTETLTIPSGLTGQYYLVLITNFANVNQNILFNQIGGTGNTNCALVSSNTFVCSGNSLAVNANIPFGLTNVNYTLIPSGLVSQSPSFVVTPSVNTSYSIISSGTNSQSIVQTQTSITNVTVNPTAVLNPTVLNTSCTNTVNAFNLGLQFNPITSNPTYSIVWNNVPSGITSASQVSSTGGIVPGIYQATVLVAGGCLSNTSFTINPLPLTANFNITPSASVYSITCFQPTLNLQATNASNSYTWTNTSSFNSIHASSANINSIEQGPWIINAINQISGCVASKTIQVVTNTTAPVTSISPSFQTINCNLTSITPVTLVANPGVNIVQNITGPQGGTYVSSLPITVFLPGGDGIYNHCVMNTVNGCSTCRTFTVYSNQGYPVFNVMSPQNFTLGCGSKSVITAQIINANTTPPGGSLTYTLLSPGSSSNINNNLSTASNFTIQTAGTWTFITKDNNSQCSTRQAITVLLNNVGPGISNLVVPRNILDCNTPTVILEASSNNQNVDYNWQYKQQGQTLNLMTNTVLVSTNNLSPNTVLISNYTLSVTDKNNLCSSQTVVAMSQNIFLPKTKISAGNNPSITCVTSTILLSNNSISGIPNGLGLPNNAPVVVSLWRGPSPQTDLQFFSTYVGSVPGVYTLTGLDLNNGCTSTGTIDIGDNRIYPIINNPPPAAAILDCAATSASLSANVLGNTSNLEYTWVPPADAKYFGTLKDKIFYTSTIGIYRVVVKDLKNGCSSSGVDTVKKGNLNVDVEPEVLYGFAPLTVNFKNKSVSTLDSSKIKSIWSFGNGESLTTNYAGQNVSTIYNLPGTYTVNVFVGKGECLATTSKVIVVDIPSKLIVPNIFTPNGDNVNDVFFLSANSLNQIYFTVYDRWGNKIFDTKSDKGNIAWDGKNQNGSLVSDGVYFYHIKASGLDKNIYNENGTITVAK